MANEGYTSVLEQSDLRSGELPCASATTSASPHSPSYVMCVLCFFGASSLSAIFVNKALLTGFSFHYPLSIFLSQIIVSLVLMVALHAFGIITIASLPLRVWSRLLFPSFLNVVNVALGLYALSSVNIPMFSALRRLTVLFTMGAEILFLKRWPSRRIASAVLALSFGAFLSAIGDVTLSPLGYHLVFFNNAATALYLTVIKRTMDVLCISPLSLSYYSYVIALPIVFGAAVYTSELQSALEEIERRSELQVPQFGLVLCLSAISASSILFSTSLCTNVTGPLTTTVTAQVKNVAQTMLGMLTWGYVPSPINVFGLGMASVAQLCFGYLKYREQVDANNLILAVKTEVAGREGLSDEGSLISSSPPMSAKAAPPAEHGREQTLGP